MWYKPYRNYFATEIGTSDFSTMCALENLGYAKLIGGVSAQNLIYFWITRKGLNWLGEQIGANIYEE